MKRKHTPPPRVTLPDDLIQDILLRLPVISLSRFKCVSKSWLSLISDPHFAKYHYELAVAPTHGLVRVKFCAEDHWKIRISSIDTDAPLHNKSAKLVFNVPKISNYRHSGSVQVVGSCRGFILLTAPSFSIIYFLIWNPLTGFQRRFNNVLPKYSYLCDFGYDSSTDDYVVVMLTIQLLGIDIHCFSLRTNSWSFTTNSAASNYDSICMFNEIAHDSLLNGALHWVVYSNGQFKIIAFNVMEKSLAEIPLPRKLRNRFCYLRVMGGCLCVYCPHEMWMMKEYKVQSSWIKLFAFSPYSSPLCDRFRPICFTKNGEILGLYKRKTLVLLNDEGELLEQSCAHGQSNHRYGLVHYTESLLSLPGDFEKLTK